MEEEIRKWIRQRCVLKGCRPGRLLYYMRVDFPGCEEQAKAILHDMVDEKEILVNEEGRLISKAYGVWYE